MFSNIAEMLGALLWNGMLCGCTVEVQTSTVAPYITQENVGQIGPVSGRKTHAGHQKCLAQLRPPGHAERQRERAGEMLI